MTPLLNLPDDLLALIVSSVESVTATFHLAMTCRAFERLAAAPLVALQATHRHVRHVYNVDETDIGTRGIPVHCTAWAQPADAVHSAALKARARRVRDEWFAIINRYVTDVMIKGSDGRVARP